MRRKTGRVMDDARILNCRSGVLPGAFACAAVRKKNSW